MTSARATARSQPPHSGLELARSLEEAAAQAGAVRSHYREGPAPRERKRFRKQLARLVVTLELLQRACLAGQVAGAAVQTTAHLLEELDDVLHEALRMHARKSDLRRLRKAVKRRRKALAALLPA